MRLGFLGFFLILDILDLVSSLSSNHFHHRTTPATTVTTTPKSVPTSRQQAVARSVAASPSSRRVFFGALLITATSTLTTPSQPSGAVTTKAAATPPEIQTAAGGKIKYATIRPALEPPASLEGDLVAIEYTGYLTDGTIFDATHAEGKKNFLMFQIGGKGVIPGISAMVQEMGVGQKVQAIIPSELAFGDKGLCLESGECLIKPGSTLVYDIYLKRSAIPPP